MDSFRATLVIDVLSSGGAQRQLCMLAEGLKRRGHDVAVLVYWSGDFFAGQLEDAGVPIVRVSARTRPHLVYGVRRAIGEMRPDVVVAFLPGPSLLMELAGLAKRGFALIVSERNLDPPRIGMGRRLRLNLHRLADAVVANSHAQHDRIGKVAPYLVGRTSAITNGVDLRRFAPAEPPRRMEPGRLRLLVLARPVAQKNPFGLLEAAEIVRRERPDIDWSIDWYGDPGIPVARDGQRWARRGRSNHQTYFDRFMAEIERRSLQERFRWHPPYHDVVSLYHAVDAMCLPSHHEGTSNVIGEAMACGVPVLASRVSDNPLLVEDGRTGLLFDPGSARDIADAMVRFADLPAEARARMGLEGRRRAEAILSPETMIDSFIRLMTRLIHDRRGARSRRPEPKTRQP